MQTVRANYFSKLKDVIEFARQCQAQPSTGWLTSSQVDLNRLLQFLNEMSIYPHVIYKKDRDAMDKFIHTSFLRLQLVVCFALLAQLC